VYVLILPLSCIGAESWLNIRPLHETASAHDRSSAEIAESSRV